MCTHKHVAGVNDIQAVRRVCRNFCAPQLASRHAAPGGDLGRGSFRTTLQREPRSTKLASNSVMDHLWLMHRKANSQVIIISIRTNRAVISHPRMFAKARASFSFPVWACICHKQCGAMHHAIAPICQSLVSARQKKNGAHKYVLLTQDIQKAGEAQSNVKCANTKGHARN